MIGWRFIPTDDLDSGQIAVTLLAEEVGDGVTKGTEVRRGGRAWQGRFGDPHRRRPGDHGAPRPAGADRTHRMPWSIDYSPANLFGITQISLLAQQGGSPLRSGTTINLTGAQRDRVHDATVSTMLLSLAQR